MKRLLPLLAGLLLTTFLPAQDIINMELLATRNYPEQQNDVWGYAKNGVEYAVLGTRRATVIFSLEDPRNPKERAYIAGAQSIWRDMKHWGNYIYATTDEGADGLLVINMTKAPDTITWKFWKPDLNIRGNTGRLEKCHNLHIDEKGYAYLSGCNLNNGGPLIIDVHTDPWNPVFVGQTDARYSHDNVTRGDTCWSSDILDGFFSVIDVKDKQNPVTLATQTTTSNFTHNAWISDDGKYLFTTDERPEGKVDAYDVTDLSNIKRLDAFQPVKTKGTGVIPHNAHYYKGFVVVSWYTDGVVVLDAHKPDNLVMVGQYDTNTDYTNDFHGCWGAFPYLPSGLLLASDIENGLFVLQPKYIRACYLEGTVKDAVTKNLIPGVLVKIKSTDPNEKITNALGLFKTGQVTPGTFDVEFSANGYLSKTVPATLVNGQLTLLDVELIPLQRFRVQGKITEQGTGVAIADATVLIQGNQLELDLRTDVNGIFTADIFVGDYTITAGHWGHHEQQITSTVSSNTNDIQIQLPIGYKDDFIVDQGWVAFKNATSGGFVRGVPIGTFQGNAVVNPNEDMVADLGNTCYVTGNGGGAVGNDDVDNGFVSIASPRMDLSAMNSPTLEFYTWFYNGGGQGTPNDTLYIKIDDGNQEITVKKIKQPYSQWIRQTVNVKSFTNVLNKVRLIVYTSDFADSGHLVEAGLDVFKVTSATSVADPTEVNWHVFPNPSESFAQIQLNWNPSLKNTSVLVYNAQGQLLEKHPMNTSSSLSVGHTFQPGIYFFVLQNDQGVLDSQQWIKTQ